MRFANKTDSKLRNGY